MNFNPTISSDTLDKVSVNPLKEMEAKISSTKDLEDSLIVLEEIQKKWQMEVNTFFQRDRLFFVEKLKKMTGELKDYINEMRKSTFHEGMILTYVKKQLLEINSFSENFFKEIQTFEENKKETFQKIKDFEFRMNNFSSDAFTELPSQKCFQVGSFTNLIKSVSRPQVDKHMSCPAKERLGGFFFQSLEKEIKRLSPIQVAHSTDQESLNDPLTTFKEEFIKKMMGSSFNRIITADKISRILESEDSDRKAANSELRDKLIQMSMEL